MKLSQETKKPRIGSRKDVWVAKADQTTGGLTKREICLNASGKVVSRKRSEYARKMFDENEGLRQKFKDGAAPPINKPRASTKNGLKPAAIDDDSEEDSQSADNSPGMENARAKKTLHGKGPSRAAPKKIQSAPRKKPTMTRK
jgi:hypothetical protein